MQRGRKRGTDWEGQQRERVRTDQVECGHDRADYSGAGRSSGTGACGRHRPVAHGRTFFCVVNYFLFPWVSVLDLYGDVPGFVERPVRDGVANPGALVVCLIVEDPFNVERFLACVDISTACLTRSR